MDKKEIQNIWDAYQSVVLGEQTKWKVSFKSDHPPVTVVARNTAEAAEKAERAAKGKGRGDPIFRTAEKLDEAKKAAVTDKDDDGEGMDPVDKKALKGKHADRKDGDIDNDGDEDESDEYLHKRRQAISKKVDESIKPYVSSADDGHAVLDSKGKVVKTFKSIDQANLYLKQNYNKLLKESRNWSVYKRIQERAMQPGDTGGAPESMDDKLTASDKKFLDAHGTDLSGIDSGINGAKAAEDTANSIKASSPSAAPVRGDENRGRE